jgi:nucleotide-binding universal stress UspA family protein
MRTASEGRLHSIVSFMPQGYHMFKHILVAVDDSEAGQAAYDAAAQLASELHGSLTALHVAESSNGAGKSQGLSSEALLDACRKRNINKGVEPEVILSEGSASEEILKATATLRWDVLVIGTHGRQGVPRMFLGSVAEHVLHSTEIPVLVVRRAKKER